MKQNASVIEVLTEISQKTDMQFLYNDNELQGIQVNVSLKNATLYEMLDKIFAGLPLSYSILDSVIVISPKGKPLPVRSRIKTVTRCRERRYVSKILKWGLSPIRMVSLNWK